MKVMTHDDRKGLGDAYKVATPDENRRLYDDWAGTYDETLRRDYAYVYPERLAALFDEAGGEGPVLDIGCGTGLVAEALGARPVDGVDISPEMLAAARAKGVYRDLIEADVTKALTLPDGAYEGLVSAGTFTVGHVGPEALPELIRIAAPGALFVLGINEMVFTDLGFPEALDGFMRAGEIDLPRYETRRAYGEGAAHEKAENVFTAAIFRRR